MSTAEQPGSFPAVRLRRNRSQTWIRGLVRENRVTVDDLIWPVFVCEGKDACEAIPSMPGVNRFTIDRIGAAVKDAHGLGIPAIALFPSIDPGKKTSDAAEAFNPDNLVCQAIKAIKDSVPDVGVICDVALDPFNADGHDGLVQNGKVLNDETVEVLCKQAVNQAAAGCDINAPSDMMDGRIGAIRKALDAAGHQENLLLAYAAKYASAFYGPFRDAVGSGDFLKGDKKTYQMDPANGDEALREVALDLQEGADMVMVKPGLPYLDIIYRVKQAFNAPTLAYNVSGEYAMLQAAAERGWADHNAVMMETLLAFKRAGADGILTYSAIAAAKLLNA